MNTPAHQAGLRAGDVLVSVQDNLVTLMTHPEVSLLYISYCNPLFDHQMQGLLTGGWAD